MNNYYFAKTENIVGDKNSVTRSVKQHCTAKACEKFNVSVYYTKIKQDYKDKIEPLIPEYLVLEKINDQFYEVYTGKLVSDFKNLRDGVGIHYLNFENREPKPINYFKKEEKEKIFRSWLVNTEEKIDAISDFFDKYEQDMINEENSSFATFEESIKKYKKIR